MKQRCRGSAAFHGFRYDTVLLRSGGTRSPTCSQEGRVISGTATNSFHLTARPWAATGVAASDLLARVKGEVAYWATQQAADGSIPDPYSQQTYAVTASNFAYGAALLVSTGNTTYLSQAVSAMDWASNHYGHTADTSTSDGLEFDITPLVNAYSLLKASGQVSSSQLATWAKDLGAITTNQNQLDSNWSTYAMNGAWLQAKAGLISVATATGFIENIWTKYQAARESGATGGLYVDGNNQPSSLSVEAVGRGNFVALIAEGYDGPSAGAMAAVSSQGSQASLLMEDPSGQVPAGGRTDDHLWVDAGYQAIDQTLAATTADPTLAGQYQTAADLTFQQMSRWQNANGTFQVTKNQFDSSQRVGFQTASTFSGYNTNLMASTATAYQEMVSGGVTEQPTQAQVGGYVYSTPTGFAASFAIAGGTAVQIETKGRTSPIFGQYWNALGVDRIGRVGWDTRLGPSDGTYNGSDGVSFGPTWQSNGNWDHLAARAATYAGTVTSSLATPVLTRLSVVWAPTSGTGPSFTQSLTITPDGILSQTTETGVVGGWGMTLPLMRDDGKTTMTQTTSNGIASVSYPGGSDAESFIALNPGTSLTAETAILGSYGNVTPVRATATGSEADTFVYQSSGGDPSAASVQSSFGLTQAGFSSNLGWVSGSLYSGRSSAGGFGSSITPSSPGATGTPDIGFSKPVNFIAQVNGGAVTSIEADAAVTAVVQGRSYALGAYAPQAVNCFLAGTRLAVEDGGEAPVELLRPGDLVRTLDGTLQLIRWIGRKHVDPDAPELLPVCIRAGAVADGLPARDLRITPEHCILLDGVLIPVRMLVNGLSIVREDAGAPFEVFHVELDRHDILLAESLAAESYLDTGNRQSFGNAAEAGLGRGWMRPAAPLGVTREIVEPIWVRLHRRAGGDGCFCPKAGALTADPRLSLRFANDREIRPQRIGVDCLVFDLHRAGRAGRLVSRCFVPAELHGPFVDDRRRLGVAGERITLRQGRMIRTLIGEDDGALEGWHAPESQDGSRWRWTDGNAALPEMAFAPGAELEVRLHRTGLYRLA